MKKLKFKLVGKAAPMGDFCFFDFAQQCDQNDKTKNAHRRSLPD